MAVSFVAAGTFASGTGTVSPGIPAGVVSTDLLLLFAETAQFGISPPAGWSHYAFTSGTAGATTGGGTTVTVTGASWTTNQYQGAYCYYYTPGGTLETIALISTNTSNQITLTGGSFFANSAGGTVVIQGAGGGTQGAAGGVSLNIFYKYATGSDTAPSVSGTNHTTAQILAYRGVPSTTLLNVKPVFSRLLTGSTAATLPGITTQVPNSWVITASGIDNDGNSTALLLPPTNSNVTSITERIDQGVNSGAGGGIYVADSQKATAGATGDYSTTGVASARVYITLAFGAQGPAAALAGTIAATATATATTLTDAPWDARANAASSASASLTTDIRMAASAAGLASRVTANLQLFPFFNASVIVSSIAYIATGKLFNTSTEVTSTGTNQRSGPAYSFRTTTSIVRLNGFVERSDNNGVSWFVQYTSGGGPGNANLAAYNPTLNQIISGGGSTSFNLFDSYGQTTYSGTFPVAANAVAIMTDGKFAFYVGNSSWYTSTTGANGTWVAQTDLPAPLTGGVHKTKVTGKWFYQSQTNTAVTSNDGLSWTNNTGVVLPAFGTNRTVAVSGDRIAVIQSGDTTVRSSADGITWTTSATLPNSFSASTPAFGASNTLFGLANRNAALSSLLISADGVSWRSYTPPSEFWSLGVQEISGIGDQLAIYSSSVAPYRVLLLEVKDGPTGVKITTTANLYTVSSVFTAGVDIAVSRSYLTTTGSYPNKEFFGHAKSPTTGTVISISFTSPLTLRSTDNARTYSLPTTGPGQTVMGVAVNSAGVFVVMSREGSLYTSTNDGVTFTQTMVGSLATTTTPHIVFFAGLFVSQSEDWDGYYYTSPDGSAWTQRFLPANNGSGDPLSGSNGYWWRGPYTANETIFFSNHQTGYVAYSTNAVSWTMLQTYSSFDDIAWAFGEYWIVGGTAVNYLDASISTLNLSTGVVTAKDGPFSSDDWPSLLLLDGVLICFIYDALTPRVRFTYDGVTWADEPLLTYPIRAGGQRGIADLGDGSLAFTSYKTYRRGVKAQLYVPSAQTPLFSANIYIAASASVSGFAVPAAFVSDIYNFQAISPAVTSTGGIPNIAYGNGLYVTMDGSTDRLHYSEDGETWNFIQGSGIVDELTFFVGSRFYRLPTSPSQTAASSSNGTSWVTLDFGTPGYSFTDVAYGNGIYMIVEYSGTTWTAANGTSFTGRSDLSGYNLVGVAFAFGAFFIAGRHQLDLTTTADGVTWNTTGIIMSDIGDVSYAGGKLFVHAYDRRSYRISTNGTTWSSVYTPEALGPSGTLIPKITFSNNQYFCFANFPAGSQLLVSYDAINWWPHDLPGGYQFGAMAHGFGGRTVINSQASGGRQSLISKKRATVAGSLANSASFAATPASVAAATGALTVQTRFAASVASEATPSANLKVGVFFAAAVSVDALASSYFAGTPAALAGTPSAATLATAALTTQIKLASAVSCEASASSNLAVAVAFQSTLTVNVVASASMTTAIRLAADVQATPITTASLSTTIRLAGSTAVQVVSSAWMLVKTQFAAALSFPVTASLTTDRFIRANAVVTPVVTAPLTAVIRLASTQSAAVTTSAALTVQGRFAGAVSAVPATAAALTAVIRLTGQGGAAPQTTATLTIVPSSLAGPVNAVVTTTGALTVQGQFAAAPKAVATGAGALTTTIRMTCACAGTASAAAELTTKMWLLPKSPRRVKKLADRRAAGLPVESRLVEVLVGVRVTIPDEQRRVYVRSQDVDVNIKSEII